MNVIKETLIGIVSRVTYHNQSTGWSVLRVQAFNSPNQQETVTVHQIKVFAGATIEFQGLWTIDQKFGRQFKASSAVEKKPATTASIEKYLGSGLIKGVGPKTASKIVRYFKNETLDIFDKNITRLIEVPGIAKKKLIMIEQAWVEHKAIKEVMMFLQGHGISTLFAVKIYKEYGDKAISIVTENPYRLANDFYGIGFFSADKVALSIGLGEDSKQRMIAAIKHVLAASREQGHCYLTEQQIHAGIVELIDIHLGRRLLDFLEIMKQENQLRVRLLMLDDLFDGDMPLERDELIDILKNPESIEKHIKKAHENREEKEKLFGDEQDQPEDRFEENYFHEEYEEHIGKHDTKVLEKLFKGSQLNKMYKRLASKLHPDKENDVDKKERMHALMQQLVSARKNKDVFTMLALYHDNIDDDSFNFDAKKITAIESLLEQKVSELNYELRQLKSDNTLEGMVWNRFKGRSNKITLML